MATIIGRYAVDDHCSWFNGRLGPERLDTRTDGRARRPDDPALRAASRYFYSALSRMVQGDASALWEAWSHADDVSAMHPIGGRNIGWRAVKQSWEQLARVAGGGHARIEDQVFHVMDHVALELGHERGSAIFGGHPIAIDWRVTNVYRRENGAWKVVHHHTDLRLP
ncbi:YybH family protein [Alsobacter sp. SYSU BS001988]